MAVAIAAEGMEWMDGWMDGGGPSWPTDRRTVKEPEGPVVIF